MNNSFLSCKDILPAYSKLVEKSVQLVAGGRLVHPCPSPDFSLNCSVAPTSDVDLDPLVWSHKHSMLRSSRELHWNEAYVTSAFVKLFVNKQASVSVDDEALSVDFLDEHRFKVENVHVIVDDVICQLLER